MNKKVIVAMIILVLIAVVIVFITINKSDKKNIQINIEELAENINKSGAFEDELVKVDSEMIKNDYGFSNEEIKEIISYQGSGATSEEIVILQINNKNSLNNIKEKINNRLEERKEAFEGYLPEEVFKIGLVILFFLHFSSKLFIFSFNVCSSKISHLERTIIWGNLPSSSL